MRVFECCQRALPALTQKEAGAHAHIWSICIEDSDDTHACAILPVELKAQRLSHTLALIVARAAADRVDVSPVGLYLRVHEGVSINF